MPYKYLDHEADIGIQATGDSVEEAFVEGAIATFNVMADIHEVKPLIEIDIKCEGNSIPLLFVGWLNELLSSADLNEMLFSGFSVTHILEKQGSYSLAGKAIGEKIDPKRHELKTEVKAATYSGLKYEVKGDKHILQCILDL
jgi:SHS2 domain-containing protein